MRKNLRATVIVRTLIAPALCIMAACHHAGPQTTASVFFYRPEVPIEEACMPADRYSELEIEQLKQIMSVNDNLGVGFRARVHLPVVPDSLIAVETDPETCSRVRATYNAHIKGNAQTRFALYVIRAGGVFVASSPEFSDREFRPQIVVDSTFKFLGQFVR